jgi:hypothetical protein
MKGTDEGGFRIAPALPYQTPKSSSQTRQPARNGIRKPTAPACTSFPHCRPAIIRSPLHRQAFRR